MVEISMRELEDVEDNVKQTETQTSRKQQGLRERSMITRMVNGTQLVALSKEQFEMLLARIKHGFSREESYKESLTIAGEEIMHVEDCCVAS